VNINLYLLSLTGETYSNVMTGAQENAKAVRSVNEFGLVIQAVKQFQYETEQTNPQYVNKNFFFLFRNCKKTPTCYKELFFARMEHHLVLPKLGVFKNTALVQEDL
jgi:hypothetical protein